MPESTRKKQGVATCRAIDARFALERRGKATVPGSPTRKIFEPPDPKVFESPAQKPIEMEPATDPDSNRAT